MKFSRLIRTLFLCVALLSGQCVFAKVVTEKQARQRAANFFAAAEIKTKVSATQPESFKLVGTFPEAATKASLTSVPAMYIFDRPTGGYVIVSGDDVARPVLGYSLSGHFPITDIPDNLRGLLQWYADILEFAREQHWSASAMAADFEPDPDNTVQLQTARWGQQSPFNDLVADINGEKPPVGCVATGIAIIMRFHKWPQRGTGTLPSYDYTQNGRQFHIEGFTLEHQYDWDKMPENYQNYSAEEAAQVARLLYDVAIMCKMAFYPGGSTASTSSALKLIDYFGYDRQMSYYNRGDGYSDAQWERLIRDEIDARRPVLLSGITSSMGHEMVIDGYNGRYFSINFGWRGSSNGFYTLSPIEGYEQYLLPYNKSQDMICRIMPDAGGTPIPIIVSSGFFCSPVNDEMGEEFSMSVLVRNLSQGAFSIDFRYALCDAEDAIKEMISSVVSLDFGPNSGIVVNSDCKITKPIAEGDRILLCMKDPDTGEWSPVVHNRQAIIVFTKRSLSELIEIGYAEDPLNPDNANPDRKREFYIKAYKDCLWTLQDVSGRELLISNLMIPNSSRSNTSVSFRTTMLNRDNPQSDTLLHEFWLPTGIYNLYIFNPATGEKMNIILEL